MPKKVAAIICAAGESKRFGGKTKKPFINVNDKPMFMYSVEIFSELDNVTQIIMPVNQEDKERVELNWGANLQFFGVKLCTGGQERFHTVAKTLEMVKDDIDLVAVHDAARCCVTKQWVTQCIQTAEKTTAAILACPVIPTIKQAKDKTITSTLDRTNLWEAQTPQIFNTKLIKKAYANLEKLPKDKISDDSQLVEALGEKVTIVPTDSTNLKITNQSDIPIAQAIIRHRKKKARPKGPLGPYSEAQW